MRRPSRLALPLAALALSGCYYSQAICGQLGVLAGRTPIAEALVEADLPDDERALLAEVPEVMAYAREALGLETGGSYETFYDTGGGPVAWSVIACAKTRFEPYTWWFPFVGEVPYKGWFDRDRAVAEARGLAEEGYDVRVGGIPAYSTLGWFDDPVYRSMLEAGRNDLISTLIHESAHQTVYAPDHAAFNESLATFVGNEGALAYLESRHGAASQEVRAARTEQADAVAFREFMHDLYERLATVYESDRSEDGKLEERERVFEDAHARFPAFRAERIRGDGYQGFAEVRLSNALLIAYRTYHSDQGGFEDVHRLCGRAWPRTLSVLAAAARADDPARWLTRWRFEAWTSRLRPR